MSHSFVVCTDFSVCALNISNEAGNETICLSESHCACKCACVCPSVCAGIHAGFCVVCTSRVGVCGSGGAGKCLIPAVGRGLLVSVLSSLLLLLRQLLVLPRHVLLPETL